MQKFNLQSLTPEQKQTRLRILELAHDANHSHIGSCLGSVDLIHGVYKVKKENEKFVLSNGHAGIALYVILEKYGKIKDENILKKLSIHPDRDESLGIYVSTGSLGQGLPIAVGMALSNRNNNVYCIISDGECAEGSIWESLRIINEQKLNNLKILVDANGWGGYDPIDTSLLAKRLEAFGFLVIKVNGHDLNEINKALQSKSKIPTIIFGETSADQLPFLKGLDAHYYVMNDNDYSLAIKLLK